MGCFWANKRGAGLILASVFVCGAANAAPNPQEARRSPLFGRGLVEDPHYTPEEVRELEDIEEIVTSFTEQSNEYREIIRELIELKYNQKRSIAFDHYEAKVLELEVEQRALRTSAIKRFEHFIKNYPDSEEHTPKTLFRLSELYFERSYDQYLQDRDNYESIIDQWVPSSGVEEPLSPEFHYEPTIAAMQRLIIEFPDYTLIDGAYYLLGYCLSEMGEMEASVQAYEQLLDARPDSRFAAEVWTRVGNHYFDENELYRARMAFERALEDEQSPFYDKALYKLAWTHYRLADPERAPEEFVKAVDAFVELLDFNERTKAEGKERGRELRPESTRYIAISFADEDWGSTDKLLRYFKDIGGRPYERDVLIELANVYFDQTRYHDSEAVLRIVQERFPNHVEAPMAQQKLIESLERNREFEGAAAARAELNVRYLSGTPWYEANKGDYDAVEAAEGLISKSLYSAALFYHSQAQKYRSSGKLQPAMDAYRQAAASYQGYLERFPHDKQLYELTFYLAECLYYSTRFSDAAVQYTEVRDAAGDTKFKADAALSVVLSYEKAAILAVRAGELDALKIQGTTERSDADDLKPREIPALRKSLIEAGDLFDGVVKDSDPNLPGILYKSAEIFFSYNHMEEARRRFLDLLKRFPDDESSIYTSNLLIESYLAVNDFEKVEAFARKTLAETETRGSGDAEFRENLVKFKTGAMFKRAERLAQGGDLEGASSLYVQLVDEDPKTQFADLALNNAAVGYEQVKRYDSASKLYERIFNEYPTSSLADTALFRVALNAERFFDFDKAIGTYEKLIKDYPQSTSRPDAVYNAALALENTQQYEASAALYQRYCSLFPERNDAPEVCFRAGSVFEKMKNPRRAIATYKAFIESYKNNSEHQDRNTEAYLRIARANELLKREKAAVKYFEATVKNAAASGDSKSAPYAAEAQFSLVERSFKKFAKLKIKGGVKQQKKGLVTKLTALKEVETAYKGILKFKQLDWTLGSLFRIGALYENVATTFINAPCPREIKRSARDLDMTVEEVCEEYVALLEEQAISIEDKAVAAYELTINKSREFQIANEWSRKTVAALNRLRPMEWPLQKDAKFFLDGEAVETPQLMNASGEKLEAPKEKKEAEQTQAKPQEKEAEDKQPEEGEKPQEGTTPAEDSPAGEGEAVEEPTSGESGDSGEKEEGT